MKPESLDLPAWLDLLPVPLWVEDRQGEIRYGNRSFRRLLCRLFDQWPHGKFLNGLPAASWEHSGADGSDTNSISWEISINGRCYCLVRAFMCEPSRDAGEAICLLHDISDYKEKENLLKDVIIEQLARKAADGREGLDGY